MTPNYALCRRYLHGSQSPPLGTNPAIAIPLVIVRRQHTSFARISLQATSQLHPHSVHRRHYLSPPNIVFNDHYLQSRNATLRRIRLGQDFMQCRRDHVCLTKAERFDDPQGCEGFCNRDRGCGGRRDGVDLGVKEGMKVKDAPEFGQQWHRFLCTSAHTLSSWIHRPPETDEERRNLHSTAPFGVHEEWRWPEAERGINRTYEGGFTICAQTAWWERAKREWEYEEEEKDG